MNAERETLRDVFRAFRKIRQVASDGLLTVLFLLAGCTSDWTTGSNPNPGSMFPAGSYFFVSGTYEQTGHGKVYRNQMYVEHFLPQKKSFPYPVVMIHGTAQTATNFLGTPDGRPGWAQYFVDRGFEVYVVDQPARARSNYTTDYGAYTEVPLSLIQYLLSVGTFPQAKLHTQWPDGEPESGNEAFDQFVASQVSFLANNTLTEQLNLAANRALLHKIGPAVFLTHSQSGPFGFEIADADPSMVKAVVSVEPSGPPFKDLYYDHKVPWYSYREPLARPYGITRLPLGFDPPLVAPDLPMVMETSPRPDELVPCYVQGEPVHKLPRLAKVPVLIVTGEASFRAPYDYCTSRFLSQAGVTNTHIELGSIGVHGNSHMMMIELNNRDSANVIMKWLISTVH